VAAARTFGAARGWKVSRDFSPAALTRGDEAADEYVSLPHDQFDHPVHYRRRADGRCAAIVSQPYLYERQTFTKVARPLGLKHEKSDGLSWHYPGRTTLVVWTAAQ
jgi:hypothetical protein